MTPALPGSRIPLGWTTHAERVHTERQVEDDRKWRKSCQELEGVILALVRVHLANYSAFICIILWATIRSRSISRARPRELPQTAPHFALVHLTQRRVPSDYYSTETDPTNTSFKGFKLELKLGLGRIR